MLKNITPTVDASRQAAVQNQIEIAFANCDRLGKAVSVLRNRLEPVSSQEPAPCGKEEEDKVWLPPLADKIRDLSANLLFIEDSVQQATRLLEI
jgi:hypothetical protein